MPRLAVPRNFILPRDVAAQSSPPSSHGQVSPKIERRIPTWVLRLGSVAAAALFAVLVGAEVIAPRTSAPVLDQASVLLVTQQVVAAFQETAPSALTGIANTPFAATTLPSPEVMMQSAQAAQVASNTSPAPARGMASARSVPSAHTTQTESPMSAKASAPTPMRFEAKAMESNVQPSHTIDAQNQPTVEAVATPGPTKAVIEPSVQTPPLESVPVFTPVRMVATLALLAALVLGALGWRKPPTL